MTLKLNDPPEQATLAKSGPAPVNPGSAPAQSSRLNPVCLEVPVTVRRLPGGEPSGASTLAQPAEEQARTVIVFEHGAVLRLASSLPAGTAVSLTNSRGHEVACRVANARNVPAIKGYVEVKFEGAANDFWGIQHGDPPSSASVPATPATILAPPVANAPAITPGVPSPRPVAVPPPPEKLQRNAPPLKAIAGPVPISPPLGEARKLRDPEPRLPAPDDQDERGRNVSQPLKIVASGNKTKTLEFADGVGPISAPRSGASVSGQRPAAASRQDFFGAGRLISVLGPTPSVASGSHGKLLLVLAGLAGGLAVASVGLFFIRRSNLASPVPPPPALSQLSAPAPPSSPEMNAVQPSAAPHDVSVVPPSPAALAAPAAPEPAVPAAVTSGPQVVRRSAENADAKQPPRPVAPRPVISDFKLSAPASSRPNASMLPDGPTGAADLIASGPAPAAPLAGMLPSAARTDNQPVPPSPVSGSPGSSSGPSRAARQISVTRPVYPEIAKAAHIEGTVVVSAEVDETGKVTDAKAVSGPMQLRQAAIEAVQQWKYEPALANGRPAATRVTVNIAFHFQ